ncbi:hypothetical protein [Ulvibacter litoralis]|uniref:Uncharacterized protein n=1 Tax=Ulvibacter litoralis TaxID=227084 RepID=A0A1G7I648_9FLAO|nr:hypothetical protein [Ulvibacter litoralis]SDF08181.1 hypothetical protein SAMN05421855_105114 [Ulvibacter litoralis]
MKTNSFNICPTCEHRETCILTDQKAQVWSCSEYEEISNVVVTIPQEPSVKKEDQPTMAMA